MPVCSPHKARHVERFQIRRASKFRLGFTGGLHRPCTVAAASDDSATDSSGDEITGLGNSMSDSNDGLVGRRDEQQQGLASRLAAWTSSATGRLLYQ